MFRFLLRYKAITVIILMLPYVGVVANEGRRLYHIYTHEPPMVAPQIDPKLKSELLQAKEFVAPWVGIQLNPIAQVVLCADTEDLAKIGKPENDFQKICHNYGSTLRDIARLYKHNPTEYLPEDIKLLFKDNPKNEAWTKYINDIFKKQSERIALRSEVEKNIDTNFKLTFLEFKKYYRDYSNDKEILNKVRDKVIGKVKNEKMFDFKQLTGLRNDFQMDEQIVKTIRKRATDLLEAKLPKTISLDEKVRVVGVGYEERSKITVDGQPLSSDFAGLNEFTYNKKTKPKIVLAGFGDVLDIQPTPRSAAVVKYLKARKLLELDWTAKSWKEFCDVVIPLRSDLTDDIQAFLKDKDLDYVADLLLDP